MNTKFTKGKWSLWGDWAIKSDSKYLIADISTGIEDKVEYLANASLISSAPDMYYALLSMSKGEGLEPGVTIENILAKARGEK